MESVLEGIRGITERLRGRDEAYPVRGEIFSLEELEAHAQALALRHKLGNHQGSRALLHRLHSNERVLMDFNRTSLGAKQIRKVTPAAEWLLDNYFLIEEQVQIAKRHLPARYSRELPLLENAGGARSPRVYELMKEFLMHVDAQVDATVLTRFVAAYQRGAPLKLGELWAIPIMLRLGLIENLRRIAVRLTEFRRARDLADEWADRLEAILKRDPSDLLMGVAEMTQAKIELDSAFVAQFCRRLSMLDPAVQFVRHWIEQKLARVGGSVDQMVLQDSREQAADQVSVSHSISSLRFLGACDWRDFVEQLSVVEKRLREDPAGVYGRMDFATRDQYRHVVEQVARHGLGDEERVAAEALRQAVAAAQSYGGVDRRAHVGYYLSESMRGELEHAFHSRAPWKARFERWIQAHPLGSYLGGIVVVSLGFAGCGWGWMEAGEAGEVMRVILLLCVLLCGSQIAVALMNWLSVILVKPRLLPRMNFERGIPADARTMVVVPTLLGNLESIDRLLDILEIHYIGNKGPNIHFALLTDFQDAATEHAATDQERMDHVSAGIRALRKKYGGEGAETFFLLHRPRRWNPSEGVWMAYERKRGKLEEFNALLRGRGEDRFSVLIGNLREVGEVRYVITLDTDTQLPPDAAGRLAGTIAHPLNRPRMDEATGLVLDGYGILQPRVAVSLPSAARSWFVKLFAGDAGIDPYTRSVSDVYQDLFGEGSFIGKGIYDVDAFESALRGRFPENTILSHDLIESGYARSALVSDVELYEEHPSRYQADVNRRHRWVRGDWQIAAWLLPRVPGGDARRIVNPLSGLSKWKILDNLRRSLVPPALLGLIVVGSGWRPGLEWVGPVMALMVMLIPVLLTLAGQAFRKPSEGSWHMHGRSVLRNVLYEMAHAGLALLFLPYDAWMSLDAIGRTMYRMVWTRKKMLEWQTSSDAERNAGTELGSFYRSMWIVPLLGLVMLAWAATGTWEGFWILALIGAGWMLGPWVAWGISQPIPAKPTRLLESEIRMMRVWARKTWHFFEFVVSKEDHWLPPDNYQEEPVPVLASRTSPTNIGLGMLSVLGALDMGYVTQRDVVIMLRRTFQSLSKMDRFKGHFFNWYDTRTLQPLMPQYVSSVDSGNLAGCLLILSSGLKECVDRPLYDGCLFEGLRDTLAVMIDAGGRSNLLVGIGNELSLVPSSPTEALHLLNRVISRVEEWAEQEGAMDEQVAAWHKRFRTEAEGHREELRNFHPWVDGHDWSLGEMSWGDEFKGNPSLSQLEALCERSLEWMNAREGSGMNGRGGDRTVERLEAMRRQLLSLGERVRERRIGLEMLAFDLHAMADGMDFGFLYDEARKLFVTGYNVSELRRDQGHYDLLASEARITSFVAIAQGQVKQEHWFSMGRLLTAPNGEPVLVSWAGSMFEYLMPMLIMPSYDGTLLERSCVAAVHAQIQYGRVKGVPWGISESGYNMTDAAHNYQYRAFGVPGLGLKRGLGEDLVVAPYASVMSLMVAPKEAVRNLERLAEEDCLGELGFREALDFTSSRLTGGRTRSVVRSYMAHHQGMSFLSFVYLLAGRPMQRRFLLDPRFKASELLLQERVPKNLSRIEAPEQELERELDQDAEPGEEPMGEAGLRVYTDPNPAHPEVHLLSNGRYHVGITSSGGGYSRWGDLSVTRWQEDPTRDCWGYFCYLRDATANVLFSTAHQPTLHSGKDYQAVFSEAKAEFRQRVGDWEVHTEIGISPEDDVEVRRITLTNHSDLERELEMTTYGEVVLAPAAADAAHPAFSKLFVQTEFVPGLCALLCHRRGRSDEEVSPWLFHMMVHGEYGVEGLSFETDRCRFLGRGRSAWHAASMREGGDLSNVSGAVLDPVVSLRRMIRVAPQTTTRVEILLGVGESREAVLRLAEKYRSSRMSDRLMELAWTGANVMLRNLGVLPGDSEVYGVLASALVYMDSTRRVMATTLLNNRRNQTSLWSLGISGDLPILLLLVSEGGRMELVRKVIQAHAYWRLKGLAVDLVILNEDTSVYRQSLHEHIVKVVESSIEAQMLDKAGGIFVRKADQIPSEDRLLLQAAARVVLNDQNGSLQEQAKRRAVYVAGMPLMRPVRGPISLSGKAGVWEEEVAAVVKRLDFYNGMGGFSKDGTEYVMVLSGSGVDHEAGGEPGRGVFNGNSKDIRSMLTASSRRLISSAGNELRETMPFWFGSNREETTEVGELPSMTPAPWVNVIANPFFGTVVTECGGGYTWLENCHEYRLTPWSNDPVTDGPGEAIFVRDEESGHYWTPTPLPVRGTSDYVIRHGWGYSSFEHEEQGIKTELMICVAMDAPVKLSMLKVRNRTDRLRRLTVTGYWEWVLGELRARTLMHVSTEVDPRTGALLARNTFHPEFGQRIAFADISEADRTVTGDRSEFVGRNGSLSAPAAMRRVGLSGRTGPGMDACAAMQVEIELQPGEEREITFRLGAGRNLEEVQFLIQRFRRSDTSVQSLKGVRSHWKRVTGAVQVRTPDRALDLMVNGWLIYQTLSCRMWGRTGYYQSGGAYGFRDQLQDALALLHAEPGLVREQMLRAAGRQFREGDVQHWWHPPSGRGVRTHFSDDLLWLPFVVCHYLTAVEDWGVLQETIPFLEGRALKSGEESYYDLPQRSDQVGTLYEHCVRAIRHGAKMGEHGLPLIGCGDWNDGLNRVGNQGRGESVWLGFFFFDVLRKFEPVAERQGDVEMGAWCRERALELQQSIEMNAWDGNWYLRAFFDTGEALGSAANKECRIDSLPQSWAVLSGAGEKERSERAVDAACDALVRRDAGLIQLFDPPFDRSLPNPGYIRGYLPGVRENGGQYTHAAIWLIMALAELGKTDRAWELFHLINPIHHSSNPEQREKYKVEPYVAAADVYSCAPHEGRGGWTWYTGSAGWMYRLLVESLCGIRRCGTRLKIEPRLPTAWSEMEVEYRYMEAVYRICIRHGAKEQKEPILVTLDGVLVGKEGIELTEGKGMVQVMVEVRGAGGVPTELMQPWTPIKA